ncbi:MAG: NADH-quinone oxidoreductase subunit C [Actinomycetes bacterium]
MTDPTSEVTHGPSLQPLIDAMSGASVSAEVTQSFGDVTVAVPADQWPAALAALRDSLGLCFFDWLSAVDEGEYFSIFCHLYAPSSRDHVLVRTQIPGESPALATATQVFRGAAWHERETHEMFGIDFPGHGYLAPLLLSDEFEGHPLRKDFVLTARVSKSWPGAKEPGESGDGSPSRRKMQPPGVPDPQWGPRVIGAESAADD